jgi:hypothetical protein
MRFLCSLIFHTVSTPLFGVVAVGPVERSALFVRSASQRLAFSHMQVQGEAAYEMLWGKVRAQGVGALYAGAGANFAASWAGNYPWFAVFNTLQASVPEAAGAMKLVRNAAIGFAASSSSDCVSNSLRVVKTVRAPTCTHEPSSQ